MRKFWGILSITNIVLLLVWAVMAVNGSIDRFGLFKHSEFVLVPNIIFCLWRLMETEE